MAIPKIIEKYLDSKKVKYKHIEHRKVFTAYDSANTQHIKLGEVAKAILLKGKAGFYFGVLPAGHNCDFKAASKLANDKLSMAKEKEITSKLKTKVGLISPFGGAYGIPVILDKKLTKQKKLNLPGGSYTDSIIINTKDYIKSENPAAGNFSIKK